LEAAESPPTLIVDSGHGLQPHWLLSEPCEDRQRIEATRKRLQELTASDAVHDAARIMRLPGSHNSKFGDWLEVKIVQPHWDPRYPLKGPEEGLDQPPTNTPRKPGTEKKKKNGSNGRDTASTFTVPAGTDRRRGQAWAQAALAASAGELASAPEGSRHDTL